MKTVALVMGILSIFGMLIGFIPCLGALNWINIPFSTIGLIISIIAYTTVDDKPKANATAGIIMCGIAMIFGMIRLALGGGLL